MSQLHGAAKIVDLARQHQLRALDQFVFQVLGIEEGRGDRRHAPRLLQQCDDEIFAPRLPIGETLVRLGDLPDERDVFAGFRRISVAQDGHAVGVSPRVMPQQIIDRSDAEEFLEGPRGFPAHDRVKAIAQSDHSYSTPIKSASPRCPVT